MDDASLTWALVRASGIVAWSLLTVVVAYGFLMKTRILKNYKAPKVLMDTHTWASILALGFLAVHMIALMFDKFVSFNAFELVIPFASDWRPVEVALGIFAFWALIPVSVVGRIRARLGKKGNTIFKNVHILAYCAWPLATMHYVLAGTDSMEVWSLALITLGSSLLLFLLLMRGYVPRWKPERAQRPVRAATSDKPARTVAPAGVSVMAVDESKNTREIEENVSTLA